jgi:alanyl-tRNA synthetase
MIFIHDIIAKKRGGMKTELKYLNTKILKDKAKLIKIDKDEKGTFAVFDSTIFYPQGGGQESDKGYILIDGKKYDVEFVISDTGIVKHYGDFDSLSENIEAEMVVDENKRTINSKSHTAGHLIAAVVEKNYGITATKAYHFLNGPYVEFEGNKNIDINELNMLLQNEIDKKRKVEIKHVSRNELENVGVSVPAFLGDEIRVMKIEGFKPIPCGGTHL